MKQLQLDFSALLTQPAPPSSAPETALRKALVEAIRASALSRDEIADRMGTELGSQVTRAQLDSWTADSKGSSHRIPASFLPAFCRVTGDQRPLALLAASLGLSLADERERLFAARGRLAEQKQTLRRQESVLRALLGAEQETA